MGASVSQNDTLKTQFENILQKGTDNDKKVKFLQDIKDFDNDKKKEFWQIVNKLQSNDVKKFWNDIDLIKDNNEKRKFLKTISVLSFDERQKLFQSVPADKKGRFLAIVFGSNGKETEKSKWYDKRITYGIAFFMLILNLIIVSWWDALSEENAARTIVLVGLVTFFGVLTLSAHHNHTKNDDAQEKHATGTMRRAIAASIVLVYLISFSVITFGEFGDKELGLTTASNEIITQINQTFNEILESEDGANSEEMKNALTEEVKEKLSDLRSELTTELKSQETILGHFTTVVTAVIGFYFGSKAVESLVKKNGGKNNKNGKTAETPEKKNETDLTKKLVKIEKMIDKIEKKIEGAD